MVAGDAVLFAALEETIGPDGPGLTPATDGETAFRLLTRPDTTMLVLEDQLQDIRGMELLKRVRREPQTRSKPVIFVSGQDDEIDRVLAFELGADDFVPKPFSPRELALRIRAVLRRARRQQTAVAEKLNLGPISVDLAGHEAKVNGSPISLTALEFRLLADLARHGGQVRSRAQLLRTVWNHPGTLDTRTVDTHVKRLREKLGAGATWIETVRGVGYRFRNVS